MSSTPATPLSHHEILSVVEPFTRAGHRVDLAASDRAARRLLFKPVEHAAGCTDDGSPNPAFTESLQLDNPSSGTWRLTRTLALGPGLQSSLQAEGDTPAELLQCVSAMALHRQFSAWPGVLLVRSYKLEKSAADPARAPLTLTQASAQLDGLMLRMKVSPVRGISAEIELEAAPGETLDLPEDLLAVLGWDWARLIKNRQGWGTRIRLRGGGAQRSADAEAKLERGVRYLAQTLAEPPAQFHDKQVGARWAVVMRRGLPLLGSLAMVAGAAAFAKVELAEDSIVRMLIFHAPPILLMIFFSLNELPRVEIPPIPRRPRAAAWRQPRPDGAQA